MHLEVARLLVQRGADLFTALPGVYSQMISTDSALVVCANIPLSVQEQLSRELPTGPPRSAQDGRLGRCTSSANLWTKGREDLDGRLGWSWELKLDCGGQDKIRKVWHYYYKDARGL
eukprot:4620413-Amphidinium_carterae.1